MKKTDAYPQLAGNLSVSNLTGLGLTHLKTALADRAMHLPLMGQRWPQSWLTAEEILLTRLEHHIDAKTYIDCCATSGVETVIANGTLANYLHDLGKIFYFRDDYVLSNLVVLRPNWVTKAISLVLEDKVVRERNGILLHSDLPRIWATKEEGQPYGHFLYPIFLRLMERFYLSYQIESDPPGDYSTRSLIPQLLPYQPPISLPPWPKIPAKGQVQVEMVFRLNFVPAGIMSWFIVRSHRYSQNLHWREGVMLVYQDHQARVELFPMLRELRLLVWGVQPHNFFTILMHTVDDILARFEGLKIQREIPCICHWERGVAEPCSHFYRYEELVRRMEAGRSKVECPESFVEVSVPTLLYGIHPSTDNQVLVKLEENQKILRELQRGQSLILEQNAQMSELLNRNFTRQWNLEMAKMEAECPNTFLLSRSNGSHFNPKNWVSQEYRLCLICQHPPVPHLVGDGYSVRQAEEWWITLSPWLNHLIKFLQFGIPLGRAFGAVYDEVFVKQIQTNIDLLEEITKSIPEVPTLDSMNRTTVQPILHEDQRSVGSALRTLHSFLNKVDPNQSWGGLCKTLTPDGNILWLCNAHCQIYEIKPLNLEL